MSHFFCQSVHLLPRMRSNKALTFSGILKSKAPGGDSDAFAANLAEKGVFVMPGTLFDQPAHFRMCLTANETMIERALPVFAEFATTS